MAEVYDGEGWCLSQGGKRRYPREAAGPQKWGGEHRKEGKEGKVRHLEGGLIWQERRKEDKEKGTGWRTWSLSKLHPNISGESAERELW